MGYYTDYELNVERADCVDPDSGDRELGSLTRELLEREIDKLGVFDGEYGGGWYGNAKWYEHDRDMLLLSKRFPGVLFTLHGYGDDVEDIWYTYYLDGKMQVCPGTIVYDDYDPLKLKTASELGMLLEVPDQSPRYSYQSDGD